MYMYMYMYMYMHMYVCVYIYVYTHTRIFLKRVDVSRFWELGSLGGQEFVSLIESWVVPLRLYP